MEKVDFTIKGTRLPVIPVGTKSSKGTKLLQAIVENSYGLNVDGDIKIGEEDYYMTFPLSTIEALAEEQGMLYEKETERDWTGVKFKRKDDHYGTTLIIFGKIGIGVYETQISTGFLFSKHHTQAQIDEKFANGTWIEVKEEQPTLQLSPSLRDLLEDACDHERNIRKGCPMWKGVDENERLEQVKQEWAKLREVVKKLDNILNEKK